MGSNSRKELGALAVSQINRRGFNHVGGVAGLGLNVTQSGSRSWVFRYQIAGIRKDMGLGGYPDITLAQAKELARAARIKLSQGIDPIEENRAARRPPTAGASFSDSVPRTLPPAACASSLQGAVRRKPRKRHSLVGYQAGTMQKMP